MALPARKAIPHVIISSVLNKEQGANQLCINEHELCTKDQMSVCTLIRTVLQEQGAKLDHIERERDVWPGNPLGNK